LHDACGVEPHGKPPSKHLDVRQGW
jgi:hypothetical protein